MKLGIGTYTYAWALGVPGHLPKQRMSAFDLLDRAIAEDITLVQFCDNAPLTDVSPNDLDRFTERAQEAQVAIEIGTRGLDPMNLEANLALALRFHSPFIRLVIDRGDDQPRSEEAVKRLKPLVERLAETPVKLAIENHDRFTCDTLVEMIGELGEESVGICLDTVNSFGAEEPPAEVVPKLAPHALNLHIKDFTIERASHQFGLIIEGCPAGEGRLDIPKLVEEVGAHGRCHTAILEFWLPPEENVEATIEKERRWTDRSLRYLKSVL